MPNPCKSSNQIAFERRLCELEPPLQNGLRELLRAYQLAKNAERDKWDFALELKVLRRFGLSESDFRWLVCRGIVEHAREMTQKQDLRRKFQSTNVLKFKKQTCFVLTESAAQAFLGNGAASLTTTLKLGADKKAVEIIPSWDSGRHELRVAEFLVKRFRWPAKNQETVLAAFEEERWPVAGVDDPLPPHRDAHPKQRLRDTIKCLNRYQQYPYIHFRSDGTGERILWEFTPKGIEFLDMIVRQ